MKISALSLDSQLVILCQVSNHTLLTAIPLVCAQWNRLQPHACLQRRTVSLIVSSNPNQPSLFSTVPRHFILQLRQLNATYVHGLFATFPSVTHLVIKHLDVSLEALEQQLYLLQSWTLTLVSLKLIADSNWEARVNPQFSASFGRLPALFNKMPRLKRLNLTFTYVKLPPSTDFSFLGRLVDVELVFFESDHILVLQLLKHCSHNLQRLSLGYVSHFPNFLPLLTSSSICSKLDHFRVLDFDSTQLAITFDRFSRLRFLELNLYSPDEYAERLHLLTKLPSLTGLTLLFFNYIIPDEPVIAATSAPLPVLPSICYLSNVFFSFPSHEHFVQATQLDHVFPRLKQIRLDFADMATTSCWQCKTEKRDMNGCIDALLQPLAGLETLQVATVYMDNAKIVHDWLPRLCR